MLEEITKLPEQKKLFFASDFHLGAPDTTSSKEREKKIVSWLDEIQNEAAAIFLVGDIFDFWFEYRNAIPKGFIRLQGKIAELTDSGLPVIFFTGNHDMWMFEYFQNELNVKVYNDFQSMTINGLKLLVGHGDGLGKGDYSYKLLRKIFKNKFCQWAFARIHPNFGIGLAKFWSKNSQIGSGEEIYEFDKHSDFLYNFCKKIEETDHHDYYIFGHRHLPLEIKINDSSMYINLGEWVNNAHYAVFDGAKVELLNFDSYQ